MREAEHYLSSFPNVTIQSDQRLCELVFLSGIFDYLARTPIFNKFDFIITDHLIPLSEVDSLSVIFYLSNEDGRLPDYIESSGPIFTPYPPKEVHPKAFPIPLGYHGDIPNLPMKPVEQRSWEASFSGRKIHRRQSFFDQVDQIETQKKWRFKIQKTASFGGGLQPKDYAQMLNESKISFAPEGNFSNVTFRLFESMRQGCIPIAPALPSTWFFDHFPGYQIAKWDNLSQLLDNLLINNEKLVTLQKDIIQYYEQYCSEQAVAAYIKKVLQENYSL